jgi:hypothetical protein
MHSETMRKEAMGRNNISDVLRHFRLALSGAIVGTALAGIFWHALGLNGDDLTADLIGAFLGFAAVILLRTAHLS